eukprot:g46157.t1
MYYTGYPPPPMAPPVSKVGLAPPPGALAAAPGPAAVYNEPRTNLTPTTANATFNLTKLLSTGILNSKYYKQLQTDYPTFEDLVQVLEEE